MRHIIIIGALALLSSSAMADDSRYSSRGKLGEAVATKSNGQWECHCDCFSGSGSNLGRAEIPGKCEEDTEGSGCKAGGEEGFLTLCDNVFVIDD